MDILPYIILFLVVALNLFINTKGSNKIVFFILFIFSAIRYDVGYDYMSYYNTILFHPEYDRFELFESWFVRISNHYFIQLFYIINSFITVYCVKWGTERLSKNVSLSALIFLCFPLLYTHSFSVIRFWTAVSIVFLASSFLFNKKPLWYLALVILSIGFHKSAIVGLLFLPLFYLNISRIANIAILIVGFIGGQYVFGKIVGGVMPENDFSEALVMYAQRESSNSMAKIPYLYLVIDIIGLLFWQKSKGAQNEYLNKIITFFNCGVAIIFLFSFDATLSSRLCRPFLLYIIILLPQILQKFKRNYGIYQISMVSTVCVCGTLLIYLVSIYNDSLGKSEYLPYRIFFLE